MRPHDATLGWYLPSSKVRVRSDGDHCWSRHGAHWKELPGLELHGQQGPPAKLSICSWVFLDSWRAGKKQYCVICGGPGQGMRALSPPPRLLLLLRLGFSWRRTVSGWRKCAEHGDHDGDGNGGWIGPGKGPSARLQVRRRAGLVGHKPEATGSRARKMDRGQKKTIKKIKGPKQRLRRRDSGGKHTSPVRGWGGVESNDLQETREKRTATERSPVQWNVESLDPNTGLYFPLGPCEEDGIGRRTERES